MKVLLVDDQKLFVESLKVYMNTRAKDLTVVGVAYDGEDGLEMARQLRPDLVVMDVRMPGMDGVEASGILAEELPETRVLMLTTFDDDSYVFEALNNGAVGYLLKDMDPSELVEAMRAALSGSVQISPRIASKLVSAGASEAGRTPPRAQIEPAGERKSPESQEELSEGEAWQLLSVREREIVVLLARGLDNQEIAEELNVALQTVKNRVSEIYSKLDVHSRLRLIRLCQTFGWHQR